MSKFYGVKEGRKIGVYDTWAECKENVDGYSNALYKSFKNYEDAYFFVFDSYPEKDKENYIADEELEIQDKFIMPEDIDLVAYIDGSYDHSLGRFGYAGIIFHGDERREFAFSEKDPDLVDLRNVAGELKAAIHAMAMAKKLGAKNINIHYDYTGIENWALGNWKTNNDTTRKYASYAKEMMTHMTINFIKVKAHSGDKYNEEVDKLAKKALTDEDLFKD